MATNSHLKPYKSYRFTDKDPIIEATRKIVKDSGKSYAEIHRDSGVSTTCMYGWFVGETRRPQFATINAVGRACGQSLVWQSSRK